MLTQIKKLAMVAGAFTMAFTTPLAPPLSAAPQDRAGPKRSQAKPNINRPQSKNYGNNARPGGNNYANNNRPNNNRPNNNRPNNNNNNRPNYNRPGGGNNVGNTVIVAPPRGGGYNNNYNNDRYNYNDDRYNYNNNNNWDDDDNDFLDFVGKTAAITAGASILTAVIGSQTKDKPDDCQPVNANGQSYMYCNGTYYQQSGPSSEPTYTVMAPPQ